MTNNNTALQVTNFNFYGDELIALKDNATGEIYTSINSILRGIGFTQRQIKHIHKKWCEDVIVSKGVQNFVLPTKSGNQETTCISNRKLPIALTKISITPKMKQKQPELASKLELYQDKCADVLASIFIDHKITDQFILQPIVDNLNTFTKAVNDTLLSLNERISKLEENQLLMDYFGIDKNKELYKQLYKEFHNIYPDIEINQIVDDYCYEDNLDSCFTLDAIEHDKAVRKLFENMVDNLLKKYDLISENVTVKEKTIFDD